MSKPLQVITSGYTQNCKDGVLIPPTGKQINVFSSRIVNQSGGAVDAAICKKQALTNWLFYLLTAASTPDASDVTAAIQAGGGVNIFTTVDNGGFMVGSKDKFNIIGLTVSVAESASPVYAYQYWNGASWATLTPQTMPATYAVGTQLIVFAAPQDWATGTDVATGGDSTYYYIKALSTTAGGHIVTATSAWVCTFLEFQPQLANNNALQFDVLDTSLGLILSGTEQVLPYFGGTANAKNQMRVLYSTQ